MNSSLALHLAQQRPEQLRQEARQDRLARSARPAAPERPALDLRRLLVRLHLA